MIRLQQLAFVISFRNNPVVYSANSDNVAWGGGGGGWGGWGGGEEGKGGTRGKEKEV